MHTIAETKIKKVDGEYCVCAFDIVGSRLLNADYYTDDLPDAIATAAAMVRTPIDPRTF